MRVWQDEGMQKSTLSSEDVCFQKILPNTEQSYRRLVKSFKTLELSLLARDLGALWPGELSEEEDVLA